MVVVVGYRKQQRRRFARFFAEEGERDELITWRLERLLRVSSPRPIKLNSSAEPRNEGLIRRDHWLLSGQDARAIRSERATMPTGLCHKDSKLSITATGAVD